MFLHCQRDVTLILQEYDNEAETGVSSLSLNYDDEDIDIGKSFIAKATHPPPYIDFHISDVHELISAVKAVLRDYCYDRPSVLKDQILQAELSQKVLYFTITEHGTRDHLSLERPYFYGQCRWSFKTGFTVINTVKPVWSDHCQARAPVLKVETSENPCSNSYISVLRPPVLRDHIVTQSSLWRIFFETGSTVLVLKL